MERFLALIRNKYLIAGVAFVIWMCFFDRYDFGTQFAYQQEKEKLEQERTFYKSEITRIEKAISDVQYNPSESQRIGRERYKLKKHNQDIYVIRYVEPKNRHSSKNLRCFTVSPLLMSCFNASIPIFKWVSTYFSVTARSLSAVLTPSGTMGWSETSKSAPVGILLAKPTLNIVAVSISTAIARI